MNALWDVMSQRAETWCVHACSSKELRCMKDYMVMQRFIGCGLGDQLTVTINCNLRSCHMFCEAFKIGAFGTSLIIEIDSLTQLSDTSCCRPNICVVRIALCLHSKHPGLSSLWVSAVRCRAAVAGHPVDLLSWISLVRLSISSCCSFDRAGCCRCNVTIWKQMPKHTTKALLSQVRLLLGPVYTCLG
jgi:hypothetical protein